MGEWIMKKEFHFLSGLPRSGSTVLAAILNQNPHVYVTPTSPMLHLLVANQDTFWKTPEVKANPCPDQLTNVTRAMINSMWMHRPEPIIIDKNRGWGKNMPASTILFEKEIKMISTVRDLPSIMASWLVLFQKNSYNYLRIDFQTRNIPYTDKNIMHEMWHNMVKDCVESVCCAKHDAGNRILFVDYDRLVKFPYAVLEEIEQFLELPTHQYDVFNIKSNTVDDDLTAWGLDGMHQIRPELEKTSKPALEVLGEELYEYFTELEKHYDYK